MLVILLLPISVSAGLFNILWRGSDSKNLVPNKNIQNMALLVAVVAPLGNNISYIPEVKDNALVSNIGPAGSVSEIPKIVSDQISTYVVRSGDTLSQIAEMFNVTVNTIKWGNNLPSNILKVGETLVILPISGVKHVVVKKDTLSSIAKKYKGDMNEIIVYNDLKKGDSLKVGSVIIIPDGEISTPSYASYLSPSGSSGIKEYKGYYLRPIVGGRKTQGIHGHNAVDLATSVGAPILASADGKVIISKFGGWNGGYGNYVVLRHKNGTQTLYAHNSRNKVSVGETVKQGQVIAFIGTTGKSTGPHVHFEIRGARNPF